MQKSAAFLAMRRAARKVKSRHPKAKQGGRGSGPGADQHKDMDSLGSQNFPQTAPAVATPEPSISANPVALQQLSAPAATFTLHATPEAPNAAETALPSKSLPRGFRCAVYGIPPNPRLLLVVFADKTHGRVVIHPNERIKFRAGSEIWVMPAGGKDLYVLTGRYNRWGRRAD